MAHDVSGSRRMVFESEKPEELKEFFTEHLSQYQAENEIQHPAYQLRLVVEWHPNTGYWVVYSETIMKAEFGGPILQEQSFQHLCAVREASVRHAQVGDQASGI